MAWVAMNNANDFLSERSKYCLFVARSCMLQVVDVGGCLSISHLDTMCLAPSQRFHSPGRYLRLVDNRDWRDERRETYGRMRQVPLRTTAANSVHVCCHGPLTVVPAGPNLHLHNVLLPRISPSLNQHPPLRELDSVAQICICAGDLHLAHLLLPCRTRGNRHDQLRGHLLGSPCIASQTQQTAKCFNERGAQTMRTSVYLAQSMVIPPCKRGSVPSSILVRTSKRTFGPLLYSARTARVCGIIGGHRQEANSGPGEYRPALDDNQVSHFRVAGVWPTASIDLRLEELLEGKARVVVHAPCKNRQWNSLSRYH